MGSKHSNILETKRISHGVASGMKALRCSLPIPGMKYPYHVEGFKPGCQSMVGKDQSVTSSWGSSDHLAEGHTNNKTRCALARTL